MAVFDVSHHLAACPEHGWLTSLHSLVGGPLAESAASTVHLLIASNHSLRQVMGYTACPVA